MRQRNYHYRLGLLATAFAVVTITATATRNEQNGSAVDETEHDGFSLRASHLPLHNRENHRLQPHTIEDRSLIIDKEALADLEEEGEDPSSRKYKFHPPGHEANINEYAFFAHWSNAMCGASVIHDDILLTAGHCGRKATEPHWRKKVRLLSKYRESEGIVRSIVHMEVHPEFYYPKQIFDYQLIKLSSSALIDNDGKPTGVKTVKLNTHQDNPAPGDPIQAVGFGTVTPDGSTGNSHVLMDVTLQAFASEHCKNQYGSVIDSDVMVCIGSLDGSQDTCQGDSGGPMLDSSDTQVGVVSWGDGCARADKAGIASRVSAVKDWINSGVCRLSAMPPSWCSELDTISYNNRLPKTLEEQEQTETFDLLVTVSHDSAPAETAWSLTHVDSQTLLHFQDFDSIPAPFVDISHVFHHLTAGTYFFAMSDTNADGICCAYGNGSITIKNPGTNQIIWQHSGAFKDFVGVLLELNGNGNMVEEAEENTEWINPSLYTSESNDAKNGGLIDLLT